MTKPPRKRKRVKIELDQYSDKKIKTEDIKPIENTACLPPYFDEFLNRVRHMRSLKPAPVDTVGCERIGSKAQGFEPKVVRFQHLVALMLSAQTKDEYTAQAVERLRDTLNPTITPQTILTLPIPELANILCPVGFYRRKAEYLHKTASILLDKYDGDIPSTIEEITALPGVGPKMGHLLLQAAWNIVDGIGVDVHVHRLSQLWNWVPKTKNPTPEKTRLELEKWMPKSLWKEINPLLVGFGQTWCPPKRNKRSCEQCALRDICPSSLDV